jgi:hypothetical protein
LTGLKPPLHRADAATLEREGRRELTVHDQAGDPAREDAVPFSNTEFGFAPFPSVPRRSGGGSLNTVGSDADPEELATDGRDAPRDLGGPGPARPPESG